MSSIERRASVPAAVHPSSASLADILERVLDKGVVIADSTLVISNASRDRHLRREAIEHANIDAGPLSDPADR